MLAQLRMEILGQALIVEKPETAVTVTAFLFCNLISQTNGAFHVPQKDLALGSTFRRRCLVKTALISLVPNDLASKI